MKLTLILTLVIVLRSSNADDCVAPRIPNAKLRISTPSSNGSLTVEADGLHRVSPFSSISILCNSGYNLSTRGNARAFCDTGGHWFPENLATCQGTNESTFDECGIGTSGRISGGAVADPGEFPWMVRLEIFSVGLRKSQLCGGSLIHPNWVLSAAHCFANSPVAVISTLGRFNFSLPSEDTQQITAHSRIVTHPNYAGGPSHDNDFALIKLNSPARPSSRVKTLCLPDDHCNADSAIVRHSTEFDSCSNQRDSVVSAGWGKTERLVGSEVLKKINLTLYSRHNCEDLSHFSNITANQICAGVPGKEGHDTCEGDSGGPLMCIKSGRAYALGIVSYGLIGCGLLDKPAVYSRVCSVLSWIRDVLKNDTSVSEQSTSTMSSLTIVTRPIRTRATRVRRPTTLTSRRSSATCEAPYFDNAKMLNGDGEVVEPGSLVLDTISIECDDGFRIFNESMRQFTCDLSSRWQPTEFLNYEICVELMGCLHENLPGVRNGQFLAVDVKRVYGSGTSRFLSCKPGFSLNGANNVTCSTSGRWSRPGTCRATSAAKSRSNFEPLNHARFFEATKSGQFEIVKQMLQTSDLSNFDINWKTTATLPDDMVIENATALIALAANCQNLTSNANDTSVLEIFKLLIQHGANVTSTTGDGIAALSYAASNCLMPQALAIVTELIARGSPIDATDNNGRTALFWASGSGRVDVVQFLLERNASLTTASYDEGETVLMWAVVNNQTDVVEMLIRNGASLLNKRFDGRNVLMIASEDGNDEIVLYLLAQPEAPLNDKDNNGVTALMLAAMGGFVEIARKLIDAGALVNLNDNRGSNALIYATANGSTETVRLLLQHRASASNVRNDGWTALIIAARNGNVEIARLLLDHGAPLNNKDSNGRTALMWAATNGKVDIVRLLLDRGAAINESSSNGMTALVRAADQGQTAVVRLLLDRGANRMGCTHALCQS